MPLTLRPCSGIFANERTTSSRATRGLPRGDNFGGSPRLARGQRHSFGGTQRERTVRLYTGAGSRRSSPSSNPFTPYIYIRERSAARNSGLCYATADCTTDSRLDSTATTLQLPPAMPNEFSVINSGRSGVQRTSEPSKTSDDKFRIHS